MSGHIYFPMSNKTDNKKAVEHIKEVLLTVELEDDADHDAVVFLNVSRPRKSDEETIDDIDVSAHIEGCPCSLMLALVVAMEKDKTFAQVVVQASQEYIKHHTPIGEILEAIKDMAKDHEKANKNSTDASKN